ncbi:MAG: hypothetical protein OXB84_03925, partial [Halobacteriovoraceae bacterium]|nr:hypothetical protein [Halobacteriovoraceae bacterium]
LLVAVCLERSNNMSPVTHILSADLNKGQYSEKLLEVLIDFTGTFFDQVFAKKEWNEYHPHWVKVKEGDFLFYHRSSRENISLFLKAEKLLNQSSSSNESL